MVSKIFDFIKWCRNKFKVIKICSRFSDPISQKTAFDLHKDFPPASELKYNNNLYQLTWTNSFAVSILGLVNDKIEEVKDPSSYRLSFAKTDSRTFVNFSTSKLEAVVRDCSSDVKSSSVFSPLIPDGFRNGKFWDLIFDIEHFYFNSENRFLLIQGHSFQKR